MDKPPYKLTINLTSSRSDALAQAIQRLEELSTPVSPIESTVKMVIESNDEDTVLDIRDAIEVFLKAKKLVVDGKCTLTAPIVRIPKDGKQQAEQERLRQWNQSEPIRIVEAG